jgi:hypothetical protein
MSSLTAHKHGEHKRDCQDKDKVLVGSKPSGHSDPLAKSLKALVNSASTDVGSPGCCQAAGSDDRTGERKHNEEVQWGARFEIPGLVSLEGRVNSRDQIWRD